MADAEASDSASKILKKAEDRIAKLLIDVCHEFATAASSVEQWEPAQSALPSEVELDGIRSISVLSGECVSNAGKRAKAIEEYILTYQELSVSLSAVLAGLGEKNESAVKGALAELEAVDESEAKNIESWKKPSIVDDGALSVIRYALGAWLAILAIVIVAILFLGRTVGRDLVVGPNGFNYAMFLEMISVFILTATILILGLAGRLDSQAVAALIGGISGYVLGRIGAASRSGSGSSG